MRAASLAEAARLAIAAAEAAVTSVNEAQAVAAAAAREARAARAEAAAAVLPRCHCAAGWGGAPDCSVRDGVCPVGCSGHGACNATSGECECEHGWRGPYCATDDARARAARLQAHGVWEGGLFAV